MIDDSNKEELIELFLEGKLTGALLQEFLARLDSDDDFKNEVEAEKRIVHNIKLAGRKELLAKLEGYHSEMQAHSLTGIPPQAKNKSHSIQTWSRKRAWLVAALFIGAVIISGIIYNLIHNRFDSEATFLAYYKPYSGTEEGRRSGGPSSEKQMALASYAAGDYPTSISLFQNLLAKEDDEVIRFYLGSALLAGNRPAEAEQTFKNYLAKYSEFAAEARWYLSLSQLKLKKIEECRKTLQQVVNDESDFSGRAAELLIELQKI